MGGWGFARLSRSNSTAHARDCVPGVKACLCSAKNPSRNGRPSGQYMSDWRGHGPPAIGWRPPGRPPDAEHLLPPRAGDRGREQAHLLDVRSLGVLVEAIVRGRADDVATTAAAAVTTSVTRSSTRGRLPRPSSSRPPPRPRRNRRTPWSASRQGRGGRGPTARTPPPVPDHSDKPGRGRASGGLLVRVASRSHATANPPKSALSSFGSTLRRS